MKTNKLSIVALTGLSAIMLFSCKKEEVNTPTSSSEAAKATISGTAYAERNETLPGLEFAPNGTKVTATTIDPVSEKFYSYTGIITDGKYSISIPVGRDSKDYTIVFDGFSDEATIGDGTKKVKSYSVVPVAPATSLKVTLTATQNTIANVTYTPTDNNPNIYNQTATLKGTARYWGVVGTTPSYVNVPDGTKIYFKNTTDIENQDIYVTTVLEGKFQFLISTKSTKGVNYTISSESFKVNDLYYNLSSVGGTINAGAVNLTTLTFN